MNVGVRDRDKSVAAAEAKSGESPFMATLSGVGVVAIGRNEGERLERCLQSVVGKARAVVYVDSNSTDGSVALARSMGVEVVELDMSQPFSAARARNEGVDRLRELRPGLAFVQMIDGDCEVVEGWLTTAIEALQRDEKLAVVCGRRRERSPDKTVYNRMADMEWDTPVGEARSCGGDAMFRVSAFDQVGGYDPTVIAGEEPELCVRLRQTGWKVRRVDAEMTLHDADMHRFGQWWKRNVRAGHAYAQGAAMHGKTDGHNVKAVRSIWFWGVVLPALFFAVLILLCCSVAYVIMNFSSPDFMTTAPRGLPIPAIGAASILALYGVMTIRVARYRMRTHGDSLRNAWVYGVFTMLGKMPNAIGAGKFWANRLCGRQGRIIEYKGMATGTATPPG